VDYYKSGQATLFFRQDEKMQKKKQEKIMDKQKTVKPDGRYLIYYSWKTKCRHKGKTGQCQN